MAGGGVRIHRTGLLPSETPFHKGHLRRETLQPLERSGQIDVYRPSGGKGFAPGEGVQVRFK